MPGDYSRKTFDRSKHYSGVLMQQGRVQLDADWNEQLDVQLHRTETEAIDVIGTGFPKKNDGFHIGVTPAGSDITISPGRFYLDGLLCELEQACRYTTQPYFPNPKSTSPGSPPASPPSAQLNLANGTYLVFLDAWQREITALVEGHQRIREVALGGPDTTARLQNVWQVKLVRVGPLSAPNSPPNSPPSSPPQPVLNCKTAFPEFDNLTQSSSGTLNARTVEPSPSDNPCLLPPTAGYSRLENQLYRVEIQAAPPAGVPTFKWSRDNSTVETTIEAVTGSVITVRDTGKDEVLNFGGGQWVEIVDEESTLKGVARPLVQIDTVDPATRRITMMSSMAQYENVPGLRLRRWDQATNAGVNGVPVTSGVWTELEHGIQVRFSNGSFHVGDYWLIPARTATREIEWPPYAIPNTNPLAQLPRGIHHHYSRLALIEANGGQLTVVDDCRKSFPTLTEICAEDVCFDNGGCQGDLKDARTVQDAIDVLCKKREGGCTLVAVPGANLQTLFDSIPAGGDAQICFQAGTFEIPDTIVVANKGHLKLSGCGPGSRLLARNSETAILFRQCSSVLIRDLAAESEAVTSGRSQPRIGLRGTLSFSECADVNLDSVNIKCGAGASRGATCITVNNLAAQPRPARIERCSLSVGHLQSGILLVNVQRAHVEDNVIDIYAKPNRLKLPQLLQDTVLRAGFRTLLISGATGAPFNPPLATTPSHQNANLVFGTSRVGFKTHPSLKSAWTQMLQQNQPAGSPTPTQLLHHLYKLADRILIDQAFRAGFPAFNSIMNALLAEDNAYASQGITVGGEVSQEVRVINNTIRGFLQGVHVGLSRHALQSLQLIAGSIAIEGNSIGIMLAADAGKRDRHGIYVGSCRTLLIDANEVLLQRRTQSDVLLIDGIRVVGKLGNKAMITGNYLASADGNKQRSFDTGIRVQPLANLRPPSAIWLVTLNSAPSKQTTVSVSNGAQSVSNVP